MASMGDDQEENIEMWKIKKVLLFCSFLFYMLIFSRVCLVCFCSRRRDAERKPRRGKDAMAFSFVAWPPFECALFTPTFVVAFE